MIARHGGLGEPSDVDLLLLGPDDRCGAVGFGRGWSTPCGCWPGAAGCRWPKAASPPIAAGGRACCWPMNCAASVLSRRWICGSCSAGSASTPRSRTSTTTPATMRCWAGQQAGSSTTPTTSPSHRCRPRPAATWPWPARSLRQPRRLPAAQRMTGHGNGAPVISHVALQGVHAQEGN